MLGKNFGDLVARARLTLWDNVILLDVPLELRTDSMCRHEDVRADPGWADVDLQLPAG